MRWLTGIRIGRPALGALAGVSTLATVVVIHGGLARTPAQTAALAAIRERRQLVAEAKPIFLTRSTISAVTSLP